MCGGTGVQPHIFILRFLVINIINIQKAYMKNAVTNYDPHRFSMNEIFANNNGKTSSTKVVGFITSMICLLLFLMLVIYFFINPAAAAPILEFIDRTVTYFSVAAGLMGVKSITSAFGRHRMSVTNIEERPSGKPKPKHDETDDEDETEEAEVDETIIEEEG